MRMKASKTDTYCYRDDWMIDIISTSKEYKAYLYNSGYSVKELLLSSPKGQQSYEIFIRAVESDVEKDIKKYVDKHMHS